MSELAGTDPERSDFNHRDKKRWLTTVTPLSKFLSFGLFVTLPFVGFWLGSVFGSNQNSYETLIQHSTSTIDKSDRELEDIEGEGTGPVYKFVSEKVDENIFECNHQHLRLLGRVGSVDPLDYNDWPQYVSDEYSVSFVYPPGKGPNRVNFDQDNQMLTVEHWMEFPDSLHFAKGMGRPMNSSWKVGISPLDSGLPLDEMVDKLYTDCQTYSYNWCLAEALSWGYGTVESASEFGMASPAKRHYRIINFRDDDSMFLVEFIAKGMHDPSASACNFVSPIHDIDLMADSLEYVD